MVIQGVLSYDTAHCIAWCTPVKYGVNRLLKAINVHLIEDTRGGMILYICYYNCIITVMKVDYNSIQQIFISILVEVNQLKVSLLCGTRGQ